MESDMRGIGQMARDCGLTVSALRFYDSAGVLVPAWVDPQTGYRWYRSQQVRDGRLVARLRRVDMPLVDICRVLAHRHDLPAVDQVLTAHLRRLEDGLAAARHELSAARALLDRQESSMTLSSRATVAGTDLLAALGAVRFAVSTDPELPMLGGILLDLGDTSVRVVATDRYRLAVSAAPATARIGPPVSVIAPLSFVHETVALLHETVALLDGQDLSVTLGVDGDEISVRTSVRTLRGRALDYEFPDWERLLRGDASSRVRVDVATLRRELSAAPASTTRREQDGAEYEVTVLAVGPDGAFGVATDVPGSTRVGVNREFLLQALDAGDAPELVLELDGPIAPLAIRDPDRAGTFSLLMPTRLP